MSNLTIGQRQVDGITIIDLNGKVALGETNRQLHEALRALVMAGTNKIVLNLKNVTTIDSSGLGEIVAGYSTLKSNGGSLVIVNMPERVTDLMTITKLYTVFDIFENEKDALAALQNDGQSSTPLDNGFPSKAKAGTSIH
jgi:anti-sigma B factor antagonist